MDVFWWLFAPLVLLLLLLWIVMMFGPARRPRVHGGLSSSFQVVLQSVPLLHSCPRGPFDFSSALQLLIFGLQSWWEEHFFEKDYRFETEEITVTLPGDSTEGFVDRVALKWLINVGGKAARELPSDAPIVFLCPGLNCYAGSLPGTSIYSYLLQRLWRVVVFEKRGVGLGENCRLRAPAFHMFGHPSDMHEAILHVQRKWPAAPLYIVGISSGNGLAASYSILYGKEAVNLRSTLLLVGGEDYNCAFVAPRSTWLTRLLFDRVLLSSSKTRFLQRNEKLLRAHNEIAYKAAFQAESHQEFYDIVMKHFSGYTDRDEAERRINAFTGGCHKFKELTKPVLYVGTADDPVAPGGPKADWISITSKCMNAAIALYPCGSHLGCYDGFRLTRWLDRLVIQWIGAFEAETVTGSSQGQKD